jgi:hypothetical protein
MVQVEFFPGPQKTRPAMELDADIFASRPKAIRPKKKR